ncbi:VOC family protein [Streptomyces sp. NPDC051020]|uniref:VOC family protein n=1 Tax=Streptomyces sp. NPDC051020 TaxID=3155409 RepID=UPI0034161BE4
MLSTDYVPGAPNWIDLGVPDTDAAVAFYGAVFGWEFQSAGPDSGGYGFLRSGGRAVAGVGPLTEEGASPSWTVYFHTTDADATAQAVEQAGGRVRFGPYDVFTAGRLAGFTDPAGAEFGVWQPRDTRGMEVVNDPNTLSWTELYSTDAAAAKEFYRSVFSWRTRDMPMGEGLDYAVASPAGGGEHSGHAGILQLPQEHRDRGSTSEWHPYFEVTDCDAVFATATDHGATMLIPPMDARGIGRMAMMRDPAGAQLAVIKGDRD